MPVTKQRVRPYRVFYAGSTMPLLFSLDRVPTPIGAMTGLSILSVGFMLNW